MAREIDLSQFDADEVKNVQTWVEFCADLIAIDADNLDILRRALQRLVVAADRAFPQVESGEHVALGVADLGEFPLPNSVGEAFLVITGTVLLNGADGPRATGQVLERALDWINGAVLTKGATNDG